MQQCQERFDRLAPSTESMSDLVVPTGGRRGQAYEDLDC